MAATSATNQRVRTLIALAAGTLVAGVGAVNAVSGMPALGGIKMAAGVTVLASIGLAARQSAHTPMTAETDAETTTHQQQSLPTSTGFYAMVTVGCLQLGFKFFPSEVAVTGVVVSGLLVAGIHRAVQQVSD